MKADARLHQDTIPGELSTGFHPTRKSQRQSGRQLGVEELNALNTDAVDCQMLNAYHVLNSEVKTQCQIGVDL